LDRGILIEADGLAPKPAILAHLFHWINRTKCRWRTASSSLTSSHSFLFVQIWRCNLETPSAVSSS
jgi:hypothetical protein